MFPVPTPMANFAVVQQVQHPSIYGTHAYFKGVSHIPNGNCFKCMYLFTISK